MPIDARNSAQRTIQATWMQPVAAGTATTFADESAGFHAHTTGNITIRLVGDNADRTIPVIQGVFYPYSVISCPSSNAVAFTALFNTGAP